MAVCLKRQNPGGMNRPGRKSGGCALYALRRRWGQGGLRAPPYARHNIVHHVGMLLANLFSSNAGFAQLFVGYSLFPEPGMWSDLHGAASIMARQ